MLNLDIILLNNLLSGALTYVNNFKRDTYPLILSNRFLLPNSFHAVEGRRNYFPGSKTVGCSTSEAMTGFARACFYAHEATNNEAWKTLGLNIIQSFTDYFFVDDIPVNTNIWDSHWLCISFGSSVTKGIHPNTNPVTDPFNYGNFDTIVNFNNGIGLLGNNLISDIYKVYNGELKYKNVYAPLLEGGTEYKVDYWVSNYSLEGTTFRIKPDGTRTQTNETIGTIKLLTNYTGQAKVTWSDYSGGTVSAPISVRQGQGLLEPYPMWHACKKQDGRTFLNTAFDTYWWGWEAFELAYRFTNDMKWKRAANSFRYTAQQAMRIENISYYYKKENSSYPFRYPGTQAFTTNNLTNPTPTIVATRETTQDKLNYLKLDIGTAVANSFPTTEVQNFVVQTEINALVQVYAEAAISKEAIIEIKLSTSQDAFDFTQEYIGYWSLSGDSLARSIQFNTRDFVKWNGIYGNAVWYPTIADTPIFVFNGDGGTLSFNRVQTEILVNSIITKPVVLDINFSKNSGFAGCGLNNASFTNQPPTLRYALSGQVSMRLRDSSGNFWYITLPDTANQWQMFTPSWTSFTGIGTPATGLIQECVFEIIGDTLNNNANLKIHYLGSNNNYLPESLPIPSRVFKASIVSKIKEAHTFWVGDFRPINNPLDKIPYTPGAVPFTRNTIRVPTQTGYEVAYETIEDSWGDGMIYMGYLSPYHQLIWGDVESARNQVNMLADSFSAYTRQSQSRIRGLPQQVFLAALWDSAAFVTYGEKLPPVIKRVMGFLIPFLFDKKSEIPSFAYKLNQFSWSGADPNTGWFPYCGRVMESLGRYVYENNNDIKAKSLLTQYFTFLKQDYDARGSLRPITDILPVLDPQSNYHEPHAAALIGRAALWANLSGLNPKLTTDLIEICYNYIISQYVSSGTMFGSFAAGQPTFTHIGIEYKEYFSFWHGEIIEFLALLIKYKDYINYPSLSTPGILPSIEPIRITQLKPPDYNKESLIFSDGNRQSIRYRKSSIGYSLQIEYEVNQDELEILVNFWKQSGTSESFELPIDVKLFDRFRLLNNNAEYYRFNQSLSFDNVVATNIRGIWKLSINIVEYLS